MKKRSKKRLVTQTVLFLAGFYCLFMFGIAQLQTKFIFQSEVLPSDFVFTFGSQFDELTFTTNDGATLNALYFKVPNPKGGIIYFHGNRGSLKRWGTVAEPLTKYGYNVLVMDYRGYGKSTGERTEIKMQNDARLCYKEMRARFSEDSIIVYGRSLGSHFATLIASENNPKRLILETPFTSMTAVAQQKLPIFPMKPLIHFPFNSLKFIKKVNCPITIFHGTSDKVVRYAMGKTMFDAALTNNKVLITVPHGSHNNLAEFEVFQKGLDSVLRN